MQNPMQLFVHNYHHRHQQWITGAIHQNTFSILHHSQWPTKQKGAKPNKKSNRSSASQQLSLSVLDIARLMPDDVHLQGRLGRKERRGKILREEWNIFWLLIMSSLWEFTNELRFCMILHKNVNYCSIWKFTCIKIVKETEQKCLFYLQYVCSNTTCSLCAIQLG